MENKRTRIKLYNDEGYGIIEFSEEKLIIQVIGHFEGILCGLLSGIRIFDMVDSYQGEIKMEDGTNQDTTLYYLKNLEQYSFFKNEIENFILKYNLNKGKNLYEI